MGRRAWYRLAMRAVAAAIGLVACAHPPEPVPTAAPPVRIEVSAATVAAPTTEDSLVETRHLDPVRPASEYLSGAEPDRMARVAFYGPLFASEPVEGQPPLGGVRENGEERPEAWEGEVVAVVEERPRSLRVVIDEGGVRVVVYLGHDDLRRVVRRRAPATLGQREAPPAGQRDGVWLRPGVVAANGRVGALERVAVDDPIYAGTAWVDHEAIDVVYEPERDAETATKSEHDKRLAGGTLVATEAGQELLTTRSDLTVTQLETKGSLARIRYGSDLLVVEGWVPVASLRENLGLGYGGSGGGGWGTSGRTRYLHAGDRLYDGPQGDLIGLVVGERVLAMDDGEQEGGHAVRVNLGGWSFVRLWISAEDADHGVRWEQVYAQRVRLEPLPGAAPLSRHLTSKRPAAVRCWEAALDASPKPVSLRLNWARGLSVDVPRAPGLAPSLHGCLVEAFARIHPHGDPPRLPLEFMLHLEPTELPEHPGR